MGLPGEFLYDVLKAELGDSVQIGNPNWQTAGRPASFAPWGWVSHHTASPTTSSLAGDLHVVINGNSVAPGPIANVLSDRRDPTKVYIIAAGRCNHAGVGWWPPGKDTGNSRGFGWEAVNNGVGEYWSSEHVEVYARGIAAVNRHMGWGIDRVWTHHEYATPRGRKIDPAGPAEFRQNRPGTWSMAEWRAEVDRYLNPVEEDVSNSEVLLDYYPGGVIPGTNSPKWVRMYLDGVHLAHVWNADYSNMLEWWGIRKQTVDRGMLEAILRSSNTVNGSPFRADYYNGNFYDPGLDAAWNS